MTGQGPAWWLVLAVGLAVIGTVVGLAVQAAWAAWLDARDRREANRRNRHRRREAAMQRHPAGRDVLNRTHREAIREMDEDRRWNR